MGEQGTGWTKRRGNQHALACSTPKSGSLRETVLTLNRWEKQLSRLHLHCEGTVKSSAIFPDHNLAVDSDCFAWCPKSARWSVDSVTGRSRIRSKGSPRFVRGGFPSSSPARSSTRRRRACVGAGLISTCSPTCWTIPHRWHVVGVGGQFRSTSSNNLIAPCGSGFWHGSGVINPATSCGWRAVLARTGVIANWLNSTAG